MDHEVKIDLEDEIPPIHNLLHNLSSLELEEAKKQSQAMLKYGSSVHLNPLMALHIICGKERW